MSWFKNIFSKVIPEKSLTNINSGKTFDEMYIDLGVFDYHKEGFTISYENFTKSLNWGDITQLNVFKVDLFTTDRIDMEIVYGDKAFTISEELPGWYQLVLKTKEIFSTIPQDWDISIIQPAFAANYTTIYNKSTESPDS